MAQTNLTTDLDRAAAAAIGVRGGYQSALLPVPMAQGLPDTAPVLALTDPGNALFRVDCGAKTPMAYTYGGREVAWLPDAVKTAETAYGAIGGGTATRHPMVRIRGTVVPDLYRSERFGMSAYVFEVPNGVYTVRLHFAEGFECNYHAGMRVFDVTIGDTVVLPAFDPFTAGGGLARASVAEVRGCTAVDGVLKIGFLAIEGSAAVTGIEVFAGAAGATLGATMLTKPEVRAYPQPPADATRLRVLHIGNSHTFFWAMPETVAAMINTQHPNIWLQPYRYLHGGWALQHFLTQDPQAFTAINTGKYDVVVVQDSSRVQTTGYTQETWDSIVKNHARYAQAVNAAGSRMIMYLIAEPAEFPGTTASNADLIKVAKENNIILIPAREAWSALKRAEVQQSHGLMLENDGVHIGGHLGYFTACLFYIAWTGNSPVGHPQPYVVGQEIAIDPAAAAYLQQFAWDYYHAFLQDNALPSGLLPAVPAAK